MKAFVNTFLVIFSLYASFANGSRENRCGGILDSISPSKNDFYKSLLLTPEERAKAKLFLQETREDNYFYMEDIPTRLAIRSLIEDSGLNLSEKIAAIERTKQFASKDGLIIISDINPHYSSRTRASRPIISLNKISDVGTDTYLHELSHFADNLYLYDELSKRGTPNESLYEKANLAGSNRRIWTEQNALKADGSLNPFYPHLEGLRQLANDWTPNEKMPQDTIRLLKELADISNKKELVQLSFKDWSDLSPVERQISLKDYHLEPPDWYFSTPLSHWSSQTELALLDNLKRIYNEDLREYRRNSYQLKLKYLTKVLEKSWGIRNPAALIGETARWHEASIKSGRKYFPSTMQEEISSIVESPEGQKSLSFLQNTEHLPIISYEKKVKEFMLKLFPETYEEKIRERLLPALLSQGILKCPDLNSNLGDSRSSVQAITAFLNAFPIEQHSQYDMALARIKNTSTAKSFLKKIENETEIDRVEVLEAHGYPVKETVLRLLRKECGTDDYDSSRPVLMFTLSRPEILQNSRTFLQKYYAKNKYESEEVIEILEHNLKRKSSNLKSETRNQVRLFIQTLEEM